MHMATSSPSLKKALGTKEIFSMAAGAMVSSGLFVLPSVVFRIAGPSIILSYIFAGILMIPAVFSKAELATAMPKSGGTYFFVHRSMGPLFGTFAGFASWFSMSLKTAFALVGLGIVLYPFIGIVPGGRLIAVGFTMILTVLNLLSVRESGTVQVVTVAMLIALLLFYIFGGLNHIDVAHFIPFRTGGWKAVFTVTGMVFISYGGLTKVASMAEEVKDPGKTIPRGMFSAYLSVTLIYVLAVFVTVGLLTGAEVEQASAPISLGASMFTGKTGSLLLLAAAAFAFVTTANAGLLAASRVPLAMAKDNLMPAFFSRVSIRLKTPVISILFTSLFMLVVIIFLDIESLVKVASTMMLLLFMFVNVSVIIMRQSGIVSYKPRFRSPFYPYMQIVGIAAYVALIPQMGRIPLLMTAGFGVATAAWYFLYSGHRNRRESDIIQVAEKATSREIRSDTLTRELKDILIERDEIIEDRFDHIIKEAEILDVEGSIDYVDLFHSISSIFSGRFGMSEKEIHKLLMKREDESTTVIHQGLAIPHIVVKGTGRFDIAVLRCRDGVDFHKESGPVHVIFALAGSQDERNFHLLALMAIAQIVQNVDFMGSWLKARNVEELRSIILLAERVRKDQV
jgi:amino acid transporter/mannitol/fructose-specific phosphotransferase system IIA component (Ntr-type)